MTRQVDVVFNVLVNGAETAKIYPVQGRPPILSMDDSDQLKFALSGSFYDLDVIDWLHAEINPVLRIDSVENSLGYYIPTTIEETEDESSNQVSLECYDRSWRVKNKIAESRVYFAAGTPYLTAVKDLLGKAGIVLIRSTSTDAVLQEAREDWDIGTSYLNIVNQLLTEINYQELWFDASGTAVLQPFPALTTYSPDHVLDSNTVKSLLLPSFSRSLDMFSAPNVIICVCNNPDKTGQMIAVAENNAPTSPLSISRRGFRIAKKIRLDNIASQTALQAYADNQRDRYMQITERIVVQTALFAGFGVYDVTSLHYKDFSGQCTERAWTMELVTGGTMTHTLEMVVYNA